MPTPSLEHFERIHLRLDDLGLELMETKQRITSLEAMIVSIHAETRKNGVLLDRLVQQRSRRRKLLLRPRPSTGLK